MWETVDAPGVVNLVWYDFLVKRNRYRHNSYREVVVGLEADTAIPEDDGHKYDTRQLFDRKYVTRIVKEDQFEARATFERFHEGFACVGACRAACRSILYRMTHTKFTYTTMEA